jgi:formylglycine-generating enzyme required for sulfatase activity
VTAPNGANFGDCPFHKPVVIGSYPRNPFGLDAMSGDVREWVEDCYADTYAGHPSDGSAFETPSCAQRVARGGSFLSKWEGIRPTARVSLSPSLRTIDLGFRVARSL